MVELKSGEDNFSDIELAYLILLRANDTFINEKLWSIIDDSPNVNPEKIYIRKESFNLLSPDSKTVIDMVLHRPELFRSPKRRRPNKSRIIEYFKDKWGSQRIFSVMEEIRKFTKQLL